MSQRNDESTKPSRTIILAAFVGVLLLATVAVWFLWLRSGLGAQVEGKVTLDDAALAGALVVFIANDGQNPTPITGQSDDQGEYRLIPNSSAGIPPGTYKVTVTKHVLPNGSVPKGENLEQARSDGQLVNGLPSKYELITTTPLELKVQSGVNRLAIPLSSRN